MLAPCLPCRPACGAQHFGCHTCWYSAASLPVLDTTAKYALEHEMLAHYTASDLDVHIGSYIDSEVDRLVTLQKVRNPCDCYDVTTRPIQTTKPLEHFERMLHHSRRERSSELHTSRGEDLS